MLSSTLVGLMLALGVGGWTYSKTMHRTGDNNQSSLLLAGIAAFFAFVVGITIMIMINGFVGG